ncbi:hypothetical protein T07_12287, partial [Trichinella nelsoni]
LPCAYLNTQESRHTGTSLKWNKGTPSTISSHYKIEKQDRARRNKMGMHKVRIVSLSRKGVSKQDGIVEVPEETLTAKVLESCTANKLVRVE